jgi:hypothetical protein
VAVAAAAELDSRYQSKNTVPPQVQRIMHVHSGSAVAEIKAARGKCMLQPVAGYNSTKTLKFHQKQFRFDRHLKA